MKKLCILMVAFLILLAGCTAIQNSSSNTSQSSAENADNVADMPFGELTPVLDDLKKIDPVISVDVEEGYLDDELLAQKYYEIVSSSTMIKYLDMYAKNSIICSYLNPIVLDNYGITVSPENFEYIDPFNAYFEFHLSNKNSNVVIPCFTKLVFEIDETNTKAERVDFIYGSFHVFGDELVFVTLKDIYVYDLETLEKKETDFNLADVPGKNIYLSTVVKTESEMLCFALGDGYLTTMTLDENWKITDSEVLKDFKHDYSEFGLYSGNRVSYSGYFSCGIVDVYGDYVKFIANNYLIENNYYYMFNAYEKHPSLKSYELIDDFENGENPTSFISTDIKQNSDYYGRYVLNQYAMRGAGDAWYHNLAILDKETGVNTFLDTVGGMYGLGVAYGFFNNQDVYSMGYNKFKVFEKDKGYAEVLDLADSLNLDSYTKDGKKYFKALIAVHRNPQTKEFVALYADVPTDIFDRTDEFPVLSPNAVIDSQTQLPVINVALFGDALYESDTNYKIALFDSNGKLTNSFEINAPVLVNPIAFGDASISLIDNTHLKITFYMLENAPVRTGILDLTTLAFTEIQTSGVV